MAISTKFRKGKVAISELGLHAALDVTDELVLRLVAAHRKPSASISPFPFMSWFVVERARGLGLAVAVDGNELLVAKNRKCLTKLQKASEPVDRYKLGIAYGYPIPAVRRLEEMVEDKREPGTEFVLHKYETLLAGKKIPAFVAFLTHIPAHYDLKRGVIEEQSMASAIGVQTYFLQTDPDFAYRVESDHARNLVRYLGDPRFAFSNEQHNVIKDALYKLRR